MVTASARKKLPVTPVAAIRGRKTTTGVIVEKTSGVASSCSALTDGFDARLARVAMHDDVLHHHDGVVDHQPNRRGQAAQGHQVEGLPDGPEKENRNCYGYRNHQAGDQRAATSRAGRGRESCRPAQAR